MPHPEHSIEPIHGVDGALQKTFGLTAEEYSILLGDGSEAERCLLSELSVVFGQLKKKERRRFFHEELPTGVPFDSPYTPRRLPIEVAAEPDGLAQLVRATRREFSRRSGSQTETASGVPENK